MKDWLIHWLGGIVLSDLDIDIQILILQRGANKTLNIQMENMFLHATKSNYTDKEKSL